MKTQLIREIKGERIETESECLTPEKKKMPKICVRKLFNILLEGKTDNYSSIIKKMNSTKIKI